MNFSKGYIRSSPYVGIFATATDEFALLPTIASESEIKEAQRTLEVPIVKALLGNSPLLGILSKGSGRKIVVSGLSEDSEIRVLEKAGLEVLRVDSKGMTAVGNLLCFNKNGGFASPLLEDELIGEIGSFLKIRRR